MDVAILFARSDSHYKTLPDLDVYDIDRDARTYSRQLPVVAHPPCRAWGRLRKFSKPRPDEKALAFFAVEQVRRCGGVLEHPECSALWPAAGLPRPGTGRDQFGGWTMVIDQFWLGHLARKRTWCYIVGVDPREIPSFPLRLDEPTHVIVSSRRRHDGRYKGVSKKAREATPAPMADFLIEIARRARIS